MEHKYIIGEQGYPVPCENLIAWAKWFGTEGLAYRWTDHVGPLRVSTIFLGCNYTLWSVGAPTLWETMLFNDDDTIDVFGKPTPKALGQWRFTGRNEAVAFHNKKVRKLRKKHNAIKILDPTRIYSDA